MVPARLHLRHRPAALAPGRLPALFGARAALAHATRLAAVGDLPRANAHLLVAAAHLGEIEPGGDPALDPLLDHLRRAVGGAQLGPRATRRGTHEHFLLLDQLIAALLAAG